MSVVLFIEDVHHTERHFTHGFRIGAIRSGWTPKVVWLNDESGKPKSISQLTQEIENAAPDIIFWLMDRMLPFAEALFTQTLKQIPKVSFWFDDYQRTCQIHQLTNKHLDLGKVSKLQTFVWDGYWREQFQKNFSIHSLPIHLAADEVEIFPSEPTHFKGYDDAIVFTGNTPSLNHIINLSSLFPRPCQDLVHDTKKVISSSPYGRLPYESMEEAIENLSPKKKLVVNHFREDLGQRVLLNRIAWMLGKRDVRLRILRLAAHVRDVVILSGHSDTSNTQPAEFQRDLGKTKYPVKFIETSHLKAEQLGALYHIKGLQIQATDPQSVKGGIPFRVFETAAAARPLLSDFKEELSECFKPGDEILTYMSDKDFSDKLSEALKNPKRLESIGNAAHQRFLKEHTWTHRFEKIAAKCINGTRTE